MAILPSFEGVEVTIVCDGAPLVGYETDNEDVTHASPAVVLHKAKYTVTKYVKAV